MWRRPACQTLSNINNNISFHFRLFQGKANDNLKIIKKKPVSGPFWSILSVYKYFNHLPSCEKSEKTNDPFLRKMPNWQTDKQQWFFGIFSFFPLLYFHWCRLAYSNENCWKGCPLGITTTTKLVATIKPFHVSFWYISSNDNISIN